MSSILKEEKISIDLNKNFNISKLIDITELKKRLNTESSFVINKVRINKVEGLYQLKSFKNLNNITNKFLSLNLEVKSLLIFIKHILEDKEITLRKQEDVILFIYIDLLFNFYLLKSCYDNNQDYSSYLNNIRKIVGKEIIVKGSRDKSKGNNWSQSTLLETALGSIEWKRDSRPYISHRVNQALNSINAILVEIPKGYDLKKLEDSLENINATLNKFDIKNRDFILRFRKIKKLKKTGLFIKAANTIILDPRDTTSFQHELGHFIYENGLNYISQNETITKNNFDEIVKLNYNLYIEVIEKHKIEDYKESSEIFSLYFENII